MLVGTFQKFPHDENKKYCNPIDVKRKFYPELGFAPVWGFPIETLEDFLAQSVCIFPNFPEILYVVETDNYLKLDKIRWHKDRKDGTVGSIKEYIDENLPPEQSEFLLRPDDIFREGMQIKSIVNIMAIKDFIDGRCDIKTVMLEADCFPEEIAEHIKQKMTECWNVLPEFEIDKENFTFPEWEARKRSNKCKQVFCAVLLPFIYCFATGHPAYQFYTEMISVNLMRTEKLQREILEWVEKNCSEEKYFEIYNKIKELIIDDSDVLISLAEKQEIGRNDPCPCGSGKKWKKCHGKLIIG